MGEDKYIVDNKSLRPKNKNECLGNVLPKIAFILYGEQGIGKSTTVRYIAQQLRDYYKRRLVTAVFNDSLQKEILHTMMIDHDTAKCIGVSSEGDDLETVLNNTLSLCLTYSSFVVLAVRDTTDSKTKRSWADDSADICRSFGFSVIKKEIIKDTSSTPSYAKKDVAKDILDEIQKAIP